jgi:hypothetical protein
MNRSDREAVEAIRHLIASRHIVYASPVAPHGRWSEAA